MDVTFIPNKFVEPLAKCIDNAKTGDTELATVRGYQTSDISLKRKSENITGYTAEIVDNKLQISNITYADGADKAGVILLKLGSGAKDPVFALTIAYDAAYCSDDWDEETMGYTEGHTWDFSSDPLEIGSYWTNFFTTTDGKDNSINTGELTKNTSSQLYDEIDNRYAPDGTQASEWTFKYLSKVSSGNLDPTFLNIYDMEGDNADMIWETEGLWFETGSNQSCLFNEKQGSINRTDKTQLDPQRYVGILKGGEFTIPYLDQDDRVVIYMANSTTSTAGPVCFNITNALDALGKEITSEYRLGGSTFNTWQADGKNHEDPNYQGCYHFIAADNGDMTFKMVGGTICKIYKIVIYRGNHMRTNDVERANNGPLVLVNEEGATEGKSAGFTIHYRGKGEVITEPDVIVKTGNLTDASFADGKLALNSNSTGVTFTTTVGEFGNLRLRLKDMDYSGNYVCDFAERNLTVGYKEKMTYPYTWDFTDVDYFSGEDLATENDNYPETTDVHESKGWDLSLWDENGSMLLCNPDPATAMDDNYLFYHDSDKGIDNYLKGNQLFANDKIIPETKGLWFYFDNNDRAYNGSMQFTADGLRLANTKRTLANGTTTMGWWNYKMIVPSVPANNVVYLRMTRDTSVGDNDYSQKEGEDPVYFLNTSFAFGAEAKTYLSTETEVINSGNYAFYNVKGTNDWIVAVKNTTGAAENLTFTLNGWILKKMSISEDSKKLTVQGWATESREREIDSDLTWYLTGKNIETVFVNSVDLPEGAANIGKAGTLTLTRVTKPTEGAETGKVLPALEEGQAGGCLLHNMDADANVEILDGGFHLFVPDMHDQTDKARPEDTYSILKAHLSTDNYEPTAEVDGVAYTNYVLSNLAYNSKGKKYTAVAFYRVKPDGGASSKGHGAYLQIETSLVDPNNSGINAFGLVFDDGEVVTGISELTNSRVNEGAYTINGVKMDKMPTQKGVYIVNGKKVVIK